MNTTLKIVLLLVVVTVGSYYLVQGKEQKNITEVSSFEECAQAGYPIMESYPEQCRTPDGKNFVKKVEPIIPPTDEGDENEQVACTMDAMQCPDGSYVGRTGPRCQFICPPSFSSGIQGKVLLGPTCPVMRDPPDPQCADRAFETSLVLTTADGTKIVKLFNSDASGAFHISVAPGLYRISSAPGSPVMPSCSKSESVEVKINSYTETIVYCDSGIR
ncbi:MAG TPA: hypothetical protein VJH55_04270 [Candidatus Paceibacterota bacterium]